MAVTRHLRFVRRVLEASRVLVSLGLLAAGAEVMAQANWAPGPYIASPIAAADRLLVCSVPGMVTVIHIGDRLEVLARNRFREKIFATPAVADNKLYLRTADHLYALGE